MAKLTTDMLDAAVEAYLEAVTFTDSALWEEEGADDWRFSKKAVVEARRDVGQFLRDNLADCLAYAKTLGTLRPGDAVQLCAQDFWLTRNRHGAGFWDRGAGAVGQRLTKAAHEAGSADTYVSRAGVIHFS